MVEDTEAIASNGPEARLQAYKNAPAKVNSSSNYTYSNNENPEYQGKPAQPKPTAKEVLSQRDQVVKTQQAYTQPTQQEVQDRYPLAKSFTLTDKNAKPIDLSEVNKNISGKLKAGFSLGNEDLSPNNGAVPITSGNIEDVYKKSVSNNELVSKNVTAIPVVNNPQENEAVPLLGLGNPFINTSSEIPKSEIEKLSYGKEYNAFNSIFSGENKNEGFVKETLGGTKLQTKGIISKTTATLQSTSILDALQFLPIGGGGKVVESAAELVIAKGTVKNIVSGVMKEEAKPLLYGVSKVGKKYFDVSIGTEGIGVKANEKIYPQKGGNIEPTLKTTASQAKEGEANISKIFIQTGKKGITGIVPKNIDTSIVPNNILIQDFSGNTAKLLKAKKASEYGKNIYTLDVTPKNIMILGEAERSGKITREANIFQTPTKDVKKNVKGYVESAKNPSILTLERKIKDLGQFPKYKSPKDFDVEKAKSIDLDIVSLTEHKGYIGFVSPMKPKTININAATVHKAALEPENIVDYISHETLHSTLSDISPQASSGIDKIRNLTDPFEEIFNPNKNQINARKLIDIGINPDTLTPNPLTEEVKGKGFTVRDLINQKGYFDYSKSLEKRSYGELPGYEPVIELKETRHDIVRGKVVSFYRVQTKGFTQSVSGKIGSKGANKYLSDLISQTNKPVKNPLKPEEILPIRDFTESKTTSGRLNKPMRSFSTESKFTTDLRKEPIQTKTVTRDTESRLSKMFSSANTEQKTVKNYYTGFNPPQRQQRETTEFEVISYPKNIQEKFTGNQIQKQKNNSKILEQNITDILTRSKQKTNNDLLGKFSGRSDTILASLTGSKTSQITGQTTKQTTRTTTIQIQRNPNSPTPQRQNNKPPFDILFPEKDKKKYHKLNPKGNRLNYIGNQPAGSIVGIYKRNDLSYGKVKANKHEKKDYSMLTRGSIKLQNKSNIVKKLSKSKKFRL